jgi:hypothetical protein
MDVAPKCFYASGDLVAKRDGQAKAGIVPNAVEQEQVGVADTGRLNADKHFISARRGDRNFIEPQMRGLLVEANGAHHCQRRRSHSRAPESGGR